MRHNDSPTKKKEGHSKSENNACKNTVDDFHSLSVHEAILTERERKSRRFFLDRTANRACSYVPLTLAENPLNRREFHDLRGTCEKRKENEHLRPHNKANDDVVSEVKGSKD